MRIIDLCEITFGEIPKSRNPALVPKKNWPSEDGPSYILILKQQPDPPAKNCGKFAVFRIDAVEDPNKEESVTRLGLFWETEHARLFADAYVQKFNHLPESKRLPIRS